MEPVDYVSPNIGGIGQLLTATVPYVQTPHGMARLAPVTTPEIKVQAVGDLGAEIVLHGDDYDTAADRALALTRERHLVYVHPFDDPDVIAGQGNVGKALGLGMVVIIAVVMLFYILLQRRAAKWLR